MRKKPPQSHTRRFLPKKARSLAKLDGPSFVSGDPPSKKGPEAVKGSSGPADATNVTPDPARDTLGLHDPAPICNVPELFQPILLCPLCKDALRTDGSCMRCKTQYVGISAEDAARVDFELDDASDRCPNTSVTPSRYRSFWDVDKEGFAIMCFESRATGWRVWLQCFINYLDHFHGTQTRFPYWFKDQQFTARTVQILADLTDEQMKERAAHIPGRITVEHRRRYNSDEFQRAYFWLWMEQRAPWQTRVQRKAIILHRHHRVNCKVPDCRKQHRGGRTRPI